MARARSLAKYINSGIRQGLGPRAALREARAAGLTVSDHRWYKEYGVSRARVDSRLQAPTKRLDRVEPATGRWTVKGKPRSRFAYRVKALMRDRVTGATKVEWATVKSKRPMSRGRAIRQAMARFMDPDEKYPAELMGAMVVKGYEIVPEA